MPPGGVPRLTTNSPHLGVALLGSELQKPPNLIRAVLPSGAGQGKEPPSRHHFVAAGQFMTQLLPRFKPSIDLATD